MYRSVVGVVLSGLALCPADGHAEQLSGESVVGTWLLVSVDNVRADGSRVALYGEAPVGVMVLEANGRYSSQMMRAVRPRYASGKKNQGTPEEYAATAQGVNAHFGHYRVDSKNAQIEFTIEHALFPNWEGTSQKRDFSCDGKLLRYIVPTPTSGVGAVDEVVWRRAD